MKIKILKGEKIPSDKIKTGDVVDFPDRTCEKLIALGIAEEEKPKRKPRTKKAE